MVRYCPRLLIKLSKVNIWLWIVSGIFSRVEQIEALELVGASFANDKDNYDVGMAYRFFLLIAFDLLVDTFCQYLTLLNGCCQVP